MEERAKSVRKSTLTVLGTIIGAGIFGLPALFSQVGFWPGTLLFWSLALLVLLTHFLYIEIILRTKERMRLAGHARHWLGPIGFGIAAFTYPLQIVGVNFVYLLLGGEFLAAMARGLGLGGGVLFWQMLFWIGGSLTVFVGLKFVAKVEGVATWLLIVALLLVIMVASGTIHEGRAPVAQWHVFFLPFGVFLFALSGMSIIGEAADLVNRNRKNTYVAVTMGTLGAALLSWLFGAVMALAAGGRIGRTTADLIALLPGAWAWLIPVMGFLAVLTSYITTAQDLKASLHLDFHAPKKVAWFLALFAPMVLLFLTARDFLSVIDVVGTVLTGANGVLIAFIAWNVWIKNRALTWMMVASPLVAAAFLFGIIHKFFL